MSKKVSVVVPTKNSATTLEACLKTINTQSYNNIELLVVDNFSTDETPTIAKKHTSLFWKKGPERSFQRNFAVEKASGEYVCIIDSDMELGSTVIADCVKAMKKGVSGVVIPEESFGIGFWAKCKQLERSFYVGVPYMEAARFFKRSDYLKLGGYNASMTSGEDWDLSQRMESKGSLARIDSYIHHNEGHISLIRTIRKKYYYAQRFSAYATKNHNNSKVSQQTNVVSRYKLFFSKPKKLFRNPLLGLGMLFMKTCEFGFGGLGYLVSKVHRV